MLGQNKTGLSPFGILSALFTRDIMERSEQQIGWYEPLPLQFLEDGEQEEEQAPVPKINLTFDLEVLLKAIREERKKDEKAEKAPKTPEQRILERIILRERETVIRDSSARRIILESGGRQITLAARVPQTPGNYVIRRQTDKVFMSSTETSVPAAEAGKLASDRLLPSQGAITRRSAPGWDGAAYRAMNLVNGAAGRALSRREEAALSTLPGRERTADRPMRPAERSAGSRWIGSEREAASRTIAVQTSARPWSPMALASQVSVAPSGGGWEPKWQELHPGFPSALTKAEPESQGGSILLPDVMRRRRAEAIERHEKRNTQGPDDPMELALDWLSESAGTRETQIDYLETFTRRLKQAVDRTLTERRAQEKEERKKQEARHAAPEQRPGIASEGASQISRRDGIRHPDPVRTARDLKDQGEIRQSPETERTNGTRPGQASTKRAGSPDSAKAVKSKTGKASESINTADAPKTAAIEELEENEESEETVRSTETTGTISHPEHAKTTEYTDSGFMRSAENAAEPSVRRKADSRGEIPGVPDARIPERPEINQRSAESEAQAEQMDGLTDGTSEVMTGVPGSEQSQQQEVSLDLEYRETRPAEEQEAEASLERTASQVVRESEALRDHQENRIISAKADRTAQDRQLIEQRTGSDGLKSAEPQRYEPGAIESDRTEQDRHRIERKNESDSVKTSEPPETQTGIPSSEPSTQPEIAPVLEHRETQPTIEQELSSVEHDRTEQTQQVIKQRTGTTVPESAEPMEPLTGVPTAETPAQPEAAPVLEYREVQATAEQEAASSPERDEPQRREPGAIESSRTEQERQRIEKRTERDGQRASQSQGPQTAIPASEPTIHPEVASVLEYRETQPTMEQEPGSVEHDRTEQTQQVIGQRTETTVPESAEPMELLTGVPTEESPAQPEAAPVLEFREVQATAEQEASVSPERDEPQRREPGAIESGRTEQERQRIEQRNKSAIHESAEPMEPLTGVPTAKRPVQPEAAPVLEYREVQATAEQEAASSPERGEPQIREPGAVESGRTEQDRQRIEQRNERAIHESAEPMEPLTGVPTEESPVQPEAAPVLEYLEAQANGEQDPGVFPSQIKTRPSSKMGKMQGRWNEETMSGETLRPNSAIPGESARDMQSWDDQVSLTYVQPSRESRQEPSEAGGQAAQTGRVEPMGVQNLPTWAQDMLRRTGGISNESFSGPNSIQFDAMKNGAQAAAGTRMGGKNQTFPPVGTGKQIVWSAPGYSGYPSTPSSQTGPAQMVFRDRDNEPENGLPQHRGMDERELRKTADKVYRLIEERLRKELRRGGR